MRLVFAGLFDTLRCIGAIDPDSSGDEHSIIGRGMPSARVSSDVSGSILVNRESVTGQDAFEALPAGAMLLEGHSGRSGWGHQRVGALLCRLI